MQQSTLTLHKRYLLKSHLQLATSFTKPDTRKVTSLVLCVTAATTLPEGQPDHTLIFMHPVQWTCVVFTHILISTMQLYRVIHKSVKHFKNSQQINYSTDHGSSYTDTERNSPIYIYIYIYIYISQMLNVSTFGNMADIHMC